MPKLKDTIRKVIAAHPEGLSARGVRREVLKTMQASDAVITCMLSQMPNAEEFTALHKVECEHCHVPATRYVIKRGRT